MIYNSKKIGQTSASVCWKEVFLNFRYTGLFTQPVYVLPCYARHTNATLLIYSTVFVHGKSPKLEEFSFQ